jgi:hypothetical protein
MGDAGGQLAERGHLLGVDQAGLRGLQFAQGRLGGVARGVDLGLGPLALGDVAVDQHEPAAGYGIIADLDDPAVRPGTFDRALCADHAGHPTHLRIDIGGPELAALGEIAGIIGIARTPLHEGIGEVEDLLEIQVPGRQPQPGIEHRDAIAHVIESHA